MVQRQYTEEQNFLETAVFVGIFKTAILLKSFQWLELQRLFALPPFKELFKE